MNARHLLSAILLLILFRAGAQQPASFRMQAIGKEKGNYELHLYITLGKGWHLYTQNLTEEGIQAIAVSWDNAAVMRQGDSKIFQDGYLFKDPLFNNKPVKVCKDSIHLVQSIAVTGNIPAALQVKVSGFMSDNNEFLPVDENILVPLPGAVADAYGKIKLATVDLLHPYSACGATTGSAHKSLAKIFLLGLLGGLVALLTPCVFPMIPATVTYFTGTNTSKRQGIINGVFYGFCIFFIYIAASLPFHFIGGLDPTFFNGIATNVWVNLAFFFIFLFFALSFFGLFNLQLPAAFANKAGNMSQLGSLAGIFFMALTLVIVSFSCTGPILGTLLAGSIASDTAPSQLTAGMAGFGIALGLPFGAFALFPNALKRLPRAGSWMETIKVTLAFVELALSIKFLSNADLVGNWGILKREIFIGCWLLIALALSYYLISKAKDSWLVKGFALVVLAFACYLTPGLINAGTNNLSLLSGFPPPVSYSIYHNRSTHNGLVPDRVNDYQAALALAKAQGKPLLIDFTGLACVNCRKVEENVWTMPGVQSTIHDNFILVSLYVDDRTKLASPFMYNNKTLLTTGDQWASFESENFGQVSQPLYVILSPEEKLMNNPIGYEPDADKYQQWLECGLSAVRNP